MRKRAPDHCRILLRASMPRLPVLSLRCFNIWPFGPCLIRAVNCSNRTGTQVGLLARVTAPNSIFARISGRLRTDYNLGERDVLSGAYTIDDGYSLVPLADPLFASASTLRMQVASLQETHIFSPNALNVARVGFSRAGYALNSAPLGYLLAEPQFCNRHESGRNCDWRRGFDHQRHVEHYFGRSEQRRGRF